MKLLFISLLILFVIFNKRLIEPIIPDNCCGGMKLNRDYKFTDINPPVKYRRCFKPVFINGDVDGYRGWDTSPCTTNSATACCGGEATCKPTKYGGICEKEDESKFIYETTTGKKTEYNKELHDNVVVTNRATNDINFTSVNRNIDYTYLLIIFGIMILLIVIIYLFYDKKMYNKINPFKSF